MIAVVGTASLASGATPAATPVSIRVPSGRFYSYAPGTVQTGASTRYVFYCGNTARGVVTDHIMEATQHLVDGSWSVANPHVAFGPAQSPKDGFFSEHTCDPDVVAGSFRFDGTSYRWALFFTGFSHGGANQIGVAFSNNLTAGPAGWKILPRPLISSRLEFPGGCGAGTYCVGQPSALSTGGGDVELFYAGDYAGTRMRRLDLSDAADPVVSNAVDITNDGLPGEYLHDASFAFDPATGRDFVSYDTGHFGGSVVQQDTTVAWLDNRKLLAGTGTWTVLESFGSDPSVDDLPGPSAAAPELGYVGNPTGARYTTNSGLVRTPDGDVVSGSDLTDIVTATTNSGTPWNSCANLAGYRLYSLNVPVSTAPTAPGEPTLTSGPGGSLDATWEPARGRPSAPTGYSVALYRSTGTGGPIRTFTSTTTKLAIPAEDATLGDGYRVDVTADSSAGHGPVSVLSNPAEASASAPGRPDGPVDLRLTGDTGCSDTGAQVDWSSPDSHGATIKGYEVILWNAATDRYTGHEWAVPATARTFYLPTTQDKKPVLVNGDRYFIYMYTDGSTGYGTASDPSDTIIYGPPN